MEMQGLSRIEARAIGVCLVIVSGEEVVIFDGALCVETGCLLL